jgi:hypothetical protein
MLGADHPQKLNGVVTLWDSATEEWRASRLKFEDVTKLQLVYADAANPIWNIQKGYQPGELLSLHGSIIFRLRKWNVLAQLIFLENLI